MLRLETEQGKKKGKRFAWVMGTANGTWHYEIKGLIGQKTIF
jgi:hypothetical protein